MITTLLGGGQTPPSGWIHRIPKWVRKWIILPILASIALLLVSGPVTWTSVKLAEYLSKDPHSDTAIFNNIAGHLLILFGLIAYGFLIRRAKRRNRLKHIIWVTLGLIILSVFVWITWDLVTFLYHTTLDEFHEIKGVNSRVVTTTLYAIFILMPLCALLFLKWAYGRKYASKPLTGNWYQRQTKKWWWRENEFFILLGVTALHWDIYTVWPRWWLTHILGDPRIWVLFIILVVFAWMIPKGTTPYHHVLGKMGVWVAVLSMIIVWVFNPQGLEAKPSSQPAPIAMNIPRLPLPAHADPACLTLINGPKFKDHQDLVAIAYRESNCNAFEWKDGKPDPTQPLYAHLKNGGRGTAVSIWQIKPGHPECAMFDITTPEGNGDCALALHKARGIEDWRPSDPQADHVLQFPIDIASAEWSEPIKVPKDLAQIDGFHCCEVSHKVEMRINDGEPFEIGPGAKPKDGETGLINLGVINGEIRFRMVDQPVQGRITYTYR